MPQKISLKHFTISWFTMKYAENCITLAASYSAMAPHHLRLIWLFSILAMISASDRCWLSRSILFLFLLLACRDGFRQRRKPFRRFTTSLRHASLTVAPLDARAAALLQLGCLLLPLISGERYEMGPSRQSSNTPLCCCLSLSISFERWLACRSVAGIAYFSLRKFNMPLSPTSLASPGRTKRSDMYC